MYAINLNTISNQALVKIYDLDQSFINTNNYLGIACFWSYEYRHYLRDATIGQRKKVHKLFLKNNLVIDHATEKHLEIIKTITKQN
jgi:hypothetical protein